MTDKIHKAFPESPWLTPEEAAHYCKISLSLFNQKRKELPIKAGGTKRRPRFHKTELDYWMERGFKNGSKFREDAKEFHKYDLESKSDGYRVSLLD